MPGGEPRQVFGEAGLRKVLETSFYADGGTISRSPQAQLDAIMALSMLARIYDMRRIEVTPFVQDRKSVVKGKRVSVRVDLGGRRISKEKIANKTIIRVTNPHTE